MNFYFKYNIFYTFDHKISGRKVGKPLFPKDGIPILLSICVLKTVTCLL